MEEDSGWGSNEGSFEANPRTIKAKLRKMLLAGRSDHHDSKSAEAEDATVHADVARRFTERLIDLTGKEIGPGTIVATYLPMSSEPDITGFTDYLQTKGAIVLIPDLSVPPAGERVPFRLLDGQTLPSGVESLEDLLQTKEIHTIVVPSLALDQEGVRLGRGAGWYDRVLRRFTTGDSGYSEAPALIGVAFEDEFSAGEHLPREGHDQQMDYVVTEDRTLTVEK